MIFIFHKGIGEGSHSKKMKGPSLNKPRGIKISMYLIILICTTFLIWACEKTPLLKTFWPPSEPFDVRLGLLPPEIPPNHVDFDKQKPHRDEDPFEVPITVGPVTDVVHQVSQNVNANMVLDPVNEKTVLDTFPPNGTLRSGALHDDEKSTATVPAKKSDCNYAKGRWVPDKRRPLYSGFGCKQWLSKMWACRLTQRTDFSFESYRWQPQNCEMPDFKVSTFLTRMRHKTLAFIGDSLGRQQFQSMMCMVTGGKDINEVENVGKSYGLVKARGAIRPDGWAYRFLKTNTTILYYWSASLCELEPLNRSEPMTYAMHLDRPVYFLKHFLPQFDVVVLNTGHHWNKGKLIANRWEMHVEGKPISDSKIAQITNAKNFTVYSVVKWLDSQLPLHPGLKGFYRSISPRHFVNGDWNTGGSCEKTTPLANGSEVTQDHSSDLVAEGAVMGTKVKLLDITSLSQLRDECHISNYSIKPSTGAHDCLHWCLPGLPDSWNELLYAQM